MLILPGMSSIQLMVFFLSERILSKIRTLLRDTVFADETFFNGKNENGRSQGVLSSNIENEI